MNKIRILELFGGIGACSKALERLGIDYEIADYVEIDKYAVASFNAIHNTNFEPQDICTWNKDIKVDLIMHGSPCQDFSLAGKQAGGDKDSGTRSSLMYETIRIVDKLKPKYVIWENVKNLLSKKHRHNFDAYLETMEKLGYISYYQVLNAKDYGIPQNRERVFTISIRKDINKVFTFPQKQELKLKLKDMLEDEVDEKYYINDGILNNIVSDNQAGYLSGGKWNKINESCRRYYKEDGISPTIHTCQGGNTEPKVATTICLNSKGGRNGIEGLQPSLKDRIYDSNGIATCCATSNFFMPNYTVENNKSRKDIKELEKYCEYCGNKLERKRFDGRLEDFTVFSNRKYCNRECMRKDWVKIGDNHNQSYSNAHTTARKINELILHKEVCELCGSDTNLDIHHIDGNWQNNTLDNLMCLCRSCHTRYEKNKDKTELRIRKLTPLEIWRLMGFEDEDFEKAAKVNSNTQLYKQAGNSIVVNVLEAILKELLKDYICMNV